mmetsp:Transcript_45265/g.83999  ORF Transcript_45265/g.83999 Transcript_45265/m.83999 type:complete len:244 (-) Transcript_45265:1267-1998(-)
MPKRRNLSANCTGNSTVSRNSRFVSSSPPMSSHLMLGISMTDSRREEGLHLVAARAKCLAVTQIPSRSSGSSESASKSMLPSCSRTAWSAASRQSCAMSEPTKPCASFAIASTSTSGASLIFFVLMRRISARPLSSGIPTSISRSKRPKRRSAGSITLGRLVAAMTITCSFGFRPSMSVRSCDTIRFSTSPPALSRFGAIESTSSMTIMAGAFARASSKAPRRFDSDSPDLRLITSGPLINFT